MRAFWNAQLAASPQISVPDASLVNAYKSGFITTQITRSGNDLDTGVNGYESEFSHDVVGILTNLFTQGYFTDAHALLTEARNVVGAPGPVRGRPLDLLRPLGRVSAEDRRQGVRARRTSPPGAERRRGAEHRGGRARHRGRPHRADGDDGGHRRHRHPGVLDRPTTTRPCSAWPPTATSRRRSATRPRPRGPPTQYDSLLTATNACSTQTISQDHLDYLPCSLLQPNTANRCANPKDANWTSPLIRQLGLGGLRSSAPPVSGPGLTMIDATYAYGFGPPARAAPARTRPAASPATTTRAPTTPPRAPPDWPAHTIATRASWTTSS